MTSLTQAFSRALLEFVWQGTAVAGALYVALQFVPRPRANLRYALCCAALALMTLLPAVTTWELYKPVVSQAAGPQLGPTGLTFVSGGAAVVGPHSMPWLALIEAWALPVWLAGVVLFSARIVWGCAGVARLRRHGERAGREVAAAIEALSRRMGVTRVVGVLRSTVIDSPSVVGWLRPVILLPMSAASGLTPLQLEAVLAHELAHIRRHDYLVNLLQMAVEVLLFYHPAVWWVSGQVRAEREFCCDDLAVKACRDSVAYARALATLEKLRAAVPAIAVGSAGGRLLERIARIVGAPAREYGPSPLSAVLALALVLAGVGLVHGQADDGSVLVICKGCQILSRTPVEYPAPAKAAGKQGLVVVQVATDAAGNVTEASASNPKFAPAVLEEAALASVRKWKFAPGKPVVTVLFEAHPKTAQAYLMAGDMLFRAGQVDDSLRRYEAGAKDFPEQRIDFLKHMTEVYIRQNDQTHAKATMNEILKEKPGDMEARGLQASYRLDEGDVDGALAELREVVHAIPQNFVAHFNLGRAYLAKGDPDDAEVHFAAVLRMRPDHVPTLAARGQMESKRGKYAAALDDTQTLIRLKQYEKARTIVQAVLARDPANEEARAQLEDLDAKK